MKGVFCFIKLTTGDNLLSIVDVTNFKETDTKITLYFPVRLIPDEFGQFKTPSGYCCEDWLFGTEDKSIKLPMQLAMVIAAMNQEMEDFYSKVVDLDNTFEQDTDDSIDEDNVVSLFSKKKD